MPTVPVLTIDGPSGTGKGTVSERIAERLGWHFLDSGALYRAAALAALQRQLGLSDEAALANLAAGLGVRFAAAPGQGGGVYVDGQEVTDAIRTQECGDAASRIAALPEVRRALLQKQHSLRRPPGLVADGRDMGTTVFPDAILKVFLTASPEIRAERRYKQLKEKGLDVNLPRLLGEIRERDARDAERVASPLKPAEGAFILDTSALGISEVVTQILARLHQCLPAT
jgi:cytidylate kinase